MGFLEGLAGFSQTFGDLVAIIALGCSTWICVMAFVNLGYYKNINAPVKVYVAYFFFMGLGVLGQVALYITGTNPANMGVFEQSPAFTNLTLVFTLAIFVIGLHIRRQKYVSPNLYD